MATIKSIEEKAKAYDEALERAKHSDGIYPSAKELKEYIFPELRESEDERFKEELKEVLDECLNVRPQIVEEKQYMRLIAWLEKQGEQPKDVTYTHEVKTGNGNIKALVTEKVQLPKKFEKQGEQKPNPVLDIEIPFGAKDSELQEASYYIPEGFHAEIEGNRVIIKRGEQKPVGFNIGDEITVNGQVCRVVAVDRSAWSEEDEKILRTIISDGIRGAGFDMVQVDWLKSLKDRVQPKQEWSEEDEQHIDSLLKRLKGLCGNVFERTRFAISEDRDWLESLKNKVAPQNQWKPSESDILLLERIANNKSNPQDFQASLHSLIGQLKKLREE